MAKKCYKPITDPNSIPVDSVIWTGIDLDCFDICNGDSITPLMEFLANSVCDLLSTIDVTSTVLCDTLIQSLGNQNKTIGTLLQILSDETCSLRELLTQVQDQTNISNSLTLDFKCIATTDPCSDDQIKTLNQVLQLIINAFCELKNQFDNINDTIGDTINNSIEAYIDDLFITALPNRIIKQTNPTKYQFRGFVPPNCPIEFYGSLTNFDSSGKGLGIYDGWYLCVTGDTLVTLANGDKIPISTIVDNRLEVEVLSFDENTKTFIPSKVSDWYKSKVIDKNVWYKLHLKSGFSGRKILNVTNNHPVWIENKGWINTENIIEGDKVLYNSTTLTKEGKDALIGLYLSDGNYYKNRFTLVQSIINEPFTNFISNKFNVNSQTYLQKSGFGKGHFISKVRISLPTLCPELIPILEDKNKLNNFILDNISPITLAFMVMGDGHLNSDKRTTTKSERLLIHTEGFQKDDLDKFVEKMNSLGYSCKLYKRGNKNSSTSEFLSKNKTSNIGYITYFDKEGTNKLSQDIAPYIHEHYNYKLPEKYRNVECVLDNLEFLSEGFNYYEVESKNITEYGESSYNSYLKDKLYSTRYDIKVENTHSFIANGYVVHNCNGKNGTVDKRGVVAVGAIQGMNGGTLPSYINPTANPITPSANYSVGDRGGKIGVAITEAQMPSHNHDLFTTVTQNPHSHNLTVKRSGNGGGGSPAAYNSNFGDDYLVSTTSTTIDLTINTQIDPTGGGQIHENRMPYLACAYIQMID